MVYSYISPPTPPPRCPFCLIDMQYLGRFHWRCVDCGRDWIIRA